MRNEREHHSLIVISTGCGMMEVIAVDGFKFAFFGDYHETLIWVDGDGPVVAPRLAELAEADEIKLHKAPGCQLVEVKAARFVSDESITQHQADDEGHPIRDHNSTTYVSTLGPGAAFGPLLRQEAIRRGLSLAVFVVLLIDGAEGLAKEKWRAHQEALMPWPLTKRGETGRRSAAQNTSARSPVASRTR